MSLNKVVLIGNVGKDPVVRYFEKGVAKASFPLATSESYTNQQGETITSTEWHNIVLWRELAEIAEKTVKKGTQLYIVGKIKTRSYVDKDGNNKYITEILADTMFVLEKKTAPAGSQYQAAGSQNSLQDKSTPKTEVSEPGSAYQSGSMSSDSRKDAADGSPFDSMTGSSEDDLPF
jgi:single-strand DNA-binding protein